MTEPFYSKELFAYSTSELIPSIQKGYDSESLWHKTLLFLSTEFNYAFYLVIILVALLKARFTL
jgi:hypothetical protein